jgi:hypothetical protein
VFEDKLEQVSAQEKMNLLAEKFQGIMGDLATAFTPLLDTVANVAAYLGSMPGVVGATLATVSRRGTDAVAKSPIENELPSITPRSRPAPKLG